MVKLLLILKVYGRKKKKKKINYHLNNILLLIIKCRIKLTFLTLKYLMN